ncbi:MAG: hypothetical protein ACJASQ_000008 [Crocinitomicaceae bacterium]|jgi:hypothetical protein
MTKENSEKYNEEFYAVIAEGRWLQYSMVEWRIGFRFKSFTLASELGLKH